MEIEETITQKITQLETELRQLGLWRKTIPAWITDYQPEKNTAMVDFSEWLQFIFIPNHISQAKGITMMHKNLLVPMAVRHFGADVNKGRLLQILVEIDSML